MSITTFATVRAPGTRGTPGSPLSSGAVNEQFSNGWFVIAVAVFQWLVCSSSSIVSMGGVGWDTAPDPHEGGARLLVSLALPVVFRRFLVVLRRVMGHEQGSRIW